MKNLFLFLGLIGSTSFAQTTITSVADGDFYALGTWDCFCLPTTGDSVIINHDLNLNFGITYDDGSITVNASGALTDGGIDKDFYLNGGVFTNHGYVDLDGFWLDSGFVINTGNMVLDSLWTQGDMDNSGTITVFDFLHDEYVSFENTGTINVTNNFNNEGHFLNSVNGIITVVNDASNCNIQNDDAYFINDGIWCVGNDFTNCGTNDTLTGIGTLSIDGQSSNFGHVSGSLTINTPTSGFTLNSGSIDGTVNFGNSTCGLGTEESTLVFNVYPNPVSDYLVLSQYNINYSIMDLSGKITLEGLSTSGHIDVSSLNNGSYFIILKHNDQRAIKQFIKH